MRMPQQLIEAYQTYCKYLIAEQEMSDLLTVVDGVGPHIDKLLDDLEAIGRKKEARDERLSTAFASAQSHKTELEELQTSISDVLFNSIQDKLHDPIFLLHFLAGFRN